ncbi:MAG: hypothetical protein QOE61_1816 [Micromonosporaceae bacterium]|nr:hypothetical protein [Micromonosporaceae bacterium]
MVAASLTACSSARLRRVVTASAADRASRSSAMLSRCAAISSCSSGPRLEVASDR